MMGKSIKSKRTSKNLDLDKLLKKLSRQKIKMNHENGIPSETKSLKSNQFKLN